MELLSILEGISPWWWVTAALALGALEMATMSFFLIWPALAALIMAALLVASPSMSGPAQIALFAVLSVGLTFVGRYLVNNYGDGGEDVSDTLNSRAAHFIGRMGQVTSYEEGTGNIEIEGMRWRARLPEGQTAQPGDKVRVTDAQGMVLFVEKVTV